MRTNDHHFKHDFTCVSGLMGTLIIEMSPPDAKAFVDENPGFEIVGSSNAVALFYDDGRVDGSIETRSGTFHADYRAGKAASAPRPYPRIVGYDGMPQHPTTVGVAMKLDGSKWVPVVEFTPPLTLQQKNAAFEAAQQRYREHCAAASDFEKE